MDIKEFYDADEQRRSSQEFPYGLEWKDAADPAHFYDVFWVADTGELYTMRKNALSKWPGLVDQEEVETIRNEIQEYEAGVKELLSGILHPLHRSAKQAQAPSRSLESEDDDSISSLQVEVLAHIADHAQVDKRLEGWEQAISSPNSLAWLRKRLGTQ